MSGSTSFRTNPHSLVPVIFIPVTKSHAAALWMESHRVGPEYLSIIWIDESRSCNNTPQHISTEYLRYNRYHPHISVRWWDVSQSIGEESNYARTHGQRNGLPRSLITTLNLHKI